jgi:hypothetical protein
MIVYYIIRFTSLCTIVTYMSFKQKLFGAMCTIFTVWQSTHVSEDFA